MSQNLVLEFLKKLPNNNINNSDLVITEISPIFLADLISKNNCKKYPKISSINLYGNTFFEKFEVDFLIEELKLIYKLKYINKNNSFKYYEKKELEIYNNNLKELIKILESFLISNIFNYIGFYGD